jgi:hypothetical protein
MCGSQPKNRVVKTKGVGLAVVTLIFQRKGGPLVEGGGPAVDSDGPPET